MQIVNTIEDLRRLVLETRRSGRTIGFVPTMGYLHQGHLSLMQQARQENDLVIASVFVNPTQFGPNEDFDAYPRNPEQDRALMASVPVDAAFFPSVEALYPEGYATYVEVEGSLTSGLCGASRPGHFRGVATVVLKLFNLVQPDRAYFGMKDAQQVAVIRRMVRDLHVPVAVVGCPIVREPDGLAMSSRNVYLDPEERQDALVLSRSLQAAAALVQGGERQAETVIRRMQDLIAAVPSARVDYISLTDANSLEPVSALQGTVLAALAVRIGKTRLIDNTVLEIPHAD